MVIHTCLRCGATIPRATALAGSAARCPNCYAPYRPVTAPAIGSLGSAFALLICTSMLGGLVFVAGYTLMSSATPPPANSQVLSAEEFDARQAMLENQPPQFKQQGQLKAGPKIE